MNKIILYLLLLLIFTSHLTAQWTWQNPSPQGNILNNIQFADSLNGWATGYFGTIMRTTDGGENWQIAATPIKSVLIKMFFINKDIGWCSDSYNSKNTFVTNNGGLSWDTVKSLRGYYINDIQFLSPQVGYVLAWDSSSVYKTTDAGNSWEKIFTNTGSISNVSCIYFLDENTGWVGCSNSELYRTTDGGKTWKGTYVSPYYVYINAIRFVDKKTGFLAGQLIMYGGDNTISFSEFDYTLDGGATWKRSDIAEADENMLADINFFSPTEGYVSSYNSDRIYYTSNQGASWIKKEGSARSLTFAGKNRAWGISKQNIIVTTKDGWKSAIQQTPSVTSENLFSVSALDTNNIAASGEKESIVLSSDGGKTWKFSYSSNRNIYLPGICYKSNKEIFAAGDKGTVVTTKDGGNNWNRTQIDTEFNAKDISFINDSSGFIAGYNKNNAGLIYKTTDNGLSWKKTFEYPEGFNKIKFATSKLGWIAANNGVLRTTDSGETWEKMPVLNTIDYCLDAVGENVWTQAGDSLLRSTDAGKTWESYKAFNYKNTVFSVSAISFYDKNNGIEGLDGRIIRTTDGGVTWSEDKQITENYIYSIKYVNKRHAWAVGGLGMILHYDADLTGIAGNKNLLPDEYTLYQNYPNPFNPQTTIKFSTARPGMIRLKVYDILGQEITTLVNEEKQSGTYSVNFDAGKYRLSSGVYIYRIQANDFSESKKFLLLK